MKLDIGCGKNKQPGFIGVDAIAFEGVDVVHDLTQPWPWENDSVDEVYCSHTLEHFTNEERCWIARELYRVLKPNAKATFVTPHWMHERAYGDPTHKWPAVTFMSYLYWDKNWRSTQAPHTEELLKDVDFVAGATGSLEPVWAARNMEMQQFASTHYNNVCTDMVATLTKRV